MKFKIFAGRHCAGYTHGHSILCSASNRRLLVAQLFLKRHAAKTL